MLNLIFFQIIITFILIFIYLNYFNEYFLDYPNTKIKTHTKPTPYLGGIILFINLIVILFMFLLIKEPLIIDSNLLIKHLFSKSFIVIFFVSTILLIITGLYDDVYKIKYSIRLLITGSIIYFSIVTYSDLYITNINVNLFTSIDIKAIALPFTILCFLTLINMINFYDGINGQSSIYLILVFVYVYFKTSFPIIIFLSIPLIIFLYLNLRGKAFMGDSGIYGYSYIVGLIFILAYNGNLMKLEEIMLITLLPFLELLRLCFSRIIRGHSPFNGDKYHIHHMIINLHTLTKSNIILIILIIMPIIFYEIFELFYINIFMYICIYFLVIKYYKKKYSI